MKKQKWVREFTVRSDGFHGHLYRPAEDAFPGKALIVLGGGGVPYGSTLDMAEAFAGLGILSLAVGYFGVKDTPKNIVRVPVEYVEEAARRLHAMGSRTVIAAGISKGAELALTAGSLVPEINGVIALSGPSRVCMGVGSGISWVNASSWSFRGKELPYAYAPYPGMRALRDSLHARELTFRNAYERANACASPDCAIAVEKINGPVLTAAALYDSLWPSAEACGEIAARLDENGFAFPHKELVYRYAAHLLLPFETAYGKLFRVGRKYPTECAETVSRLHKEILDWLKLC